MHLEGCLPLMARCDENIVIASTEVELGLDLHAAKLVEEVGDEWGRVLILWCDLVEISEVDTESQGAILLLGKEDGCTAWRLRQLDEPLAEHVIEEFTKDSKLCAREQVDVAMRRHILSLFS